MLLVVSGIDGCGKSTQVSLLAGWLRNIGVPVFLSKAYNDEAKAILRQYINNWNSEEAIMFLFQALHSQQYFESVSAINRGYTVIADRWDESYLAYHSNFGELSRNEKLLSDINRLAFQDLLPDLGFLITIPVDLAEKRRKFRGKIERFESRSLEYFNIIQKKYLSIAKDRGWYIIDGTRNEEEVHAEIISIVQKRI